MGSVRNFLEGKVGLDEMYNKHGKDKEKVSKAEVDYRHAEGKKRCGNCAHFQPEMNSCTLVNGHIEAEYMCNAWDEQIEKQVSL